MFKRSSLSGFTLIELLGVIAIVGILATFSAISISGAVKRARDSVRERDLTNVKSALELYNQDNGEYPVQSEAAPIHTALAKLQEDGYIKKLPQDPKFKGSTTHYLYKSNGNDYVVGTQLEYTKYKENSGNVLSEISSCDPRELYDLTPAKKGNGIVRDATSACFRLTND